MTIILLIALLSAPLHAADVPVIPTCTPQQVQRVVSILDRSNLVTRYADLNTAVKNITSDQMAAGELYPVIIEAAEVFEAWEEASRDLPNCILAVTLDRTAKAAVNGALTSVSLIQLALLNVNEGARFADLKARYLYQINQWSIDDKLLTNVFDLVQQASDATPEP